MGLIPIKADPRLFNFHEKSQSLGEDEEEPYTEEDSLRFRLHVKCTKKDPNAPMIINNTHDENKLYNNPNVFSGHLKWVPVGNQRERLAGIDGKGVAALFDDILIAKMRPGQEIEMELICEKGYGKTHAKWSPVSTAYYRLVPDIKFKEDIKGADAEELVKLCPVGVFDIEDLGGSKGSKKNHTHT
jgi:DNA-directed RNA polymerase I and III subunit RPAC1